jgi:hypothetical protein
VLQSVSVLLLVCQQLPHALQFCSTL